MLSLQFGTSVVSTAETLGSLLGSYGSSFLLGGVDFSGTHVLAFGGESKVGTPKPCNYTAFGLGAETALGVLTARFLPGMSVKDAESAVMQALFRVIVEYNDSTLNGSVFIIGLDSLVPSLNCVFRHGRGDSSKESFYLSDILGEGKSEAKKEEKVEEKEESDDDMGFSLFD